MTSPSPIPPDVYPGVEFDQYAAWQAVNPSSAKYAIESAYAYDYFTKHPPKRTPPMAFGTAVHLAVWEPDLVLDRCVKWTGGRKAGKTWKVFKAVHAERLILSGDEHAAILKIRDRVQSHPAIKRILAEHGDREVSMCWDHDGLRCKGRVDFIQRRIVDLKTCHSITDRAVIRAVVDYDYNMKMAAYRDGFGKLTGDFLDTALIFACSKPPYDARVVTMDRDSPELKRGWTLWKTALERIRHGRETGEWPGVSEYEQPLFLPQYALDEEPEMELTLDGETL